MGTRIVNQIVIDNYIGHLKFLMDNHQVIVTTVTVIMNIIIIKCLIILFQEDRVY